MGRDRAGRTLGGSLGQPGAAAPRPGRGRGPALPLILGGLLLGLAIAVAATLAAWAARERALEEAGRELRNLSYILARSTDRSLQALDMMLTDVVEHARMEGALVGPEAFEAWARGATTHHRLAEGAGLLPQAASLILLGTTGERLASARFFPAPPQNLADRAYFRALSGAEGPAHHVVVGPPVTNRATGALNFHLGRRIETPDGRFLGAAVAVIEVGYLQALFAGLALGPGSSVALFRQDGVLLARHPAAEGAIGRNFSDRPQYQSTLASRDGAVVRLLSGVDGLERLMSPRALEAYPLRIHVGASVESVLAPWREVALRFGGGTLALFLLLAASVAAALRAARAERAAAAERLAMERAAAEARLRHERELSARHADFRQIVEGMSQGVWRFGADGRLALTNSRCAEVTGMPREGLLIGATLAEMEAAAAAAGEDGAVTVIRRLGLLVEAREPGAFIQDLPAGRAASVVHQPLPDGGWLATFEDVSERRAAEARVRHLARHDALTGLANRVQFHEGLAQLLGAERRGRLAVLYLDLDRFKQVNDTLGHAVGDALLRAAATRIATNVRARRGASADLVARLGGDEFAVVLRVQGGHVEETRADAAATASRLVAVLSDPFLIESQQVLVGATVGVALHPEDGTTADELLRAADLALYRAKAEGRGRHLFFDRAMDAEAQARRALELDLRHALLEDHGRGFELHYQPIVDARTRAPTGCEALVRWRRPGQSDLVSPAHFVPVAEETGLIVPLGEMVLRRACAHAAAWPDRRLRLAVNLSPAQSRDDGLVELVGGVLAETGLEPHRLELEITEGVLARGTEATLATMHRLRDLGVRFAMDDFGTGYSSLAYLRAFPFDRVKVDRAFVRDIEARPQDMAIVRAVTGLCQEIGMSAVAEGVETEGQLRILAAARCAEAQGHLFSPPVRPEELAAVLDRIAAARQPLPVQAA